MIFSNWGCWFSQDCHVKLFVCDQHSGWSLFLIMKPRLRHGKQPARRCQSQSLNPGLTLSKDQSAVVNYIRLFHSIFSNNFSKYRTPTICQTLFFITLFICYTGSYCSMWDQGSNLGSLHWEHMVLATGPPGKSLPDLFWRRGGQTFSAKVNIINIFNFAGCTRPV